MKNLQLLSWLTQLGLSTAIPLAGFVLLALWLRSRFSLGAWVLYAGIGMGLFCACSGFYRSLKLLNELAKDKGQKKPPASYSEHD